MNHHRRVVKWDKRNWIYTLKPKGTKSGYSGSNYIIENMIVRISENPLNSWNTFSIKTVNCEWIHAKAAKNEKRRSILQNYESEAPPQANPVHAH